MDCLGEPSNQASFFSILVCIVRTQNHHNKNKSKSLITKVKEMSRVSGLMINTRKKKFVGIRAILINIIHHFI